VNHEHRHVLLLGQTFRHAVAVIGVVGAGLGIKVLNSDDKGDPEFVLQIRILISFGASTAFRLSA
jgi:hypothetical protein